MFRIHLARLIVLGAAVFLAGCNCTSRNSCSTCSDRPGLFSRFRTASSTQPVVISSGDCCNGSMNGPMLPPPQPGIPPGPPQNSTIPRIDEAPQKLYDPKMSGRVGTKTGNPIQ